MLAARTGSMPTTFPAAAYVCHAHGVAFHVSSTRGYGVTVMKIVDTLPASGESRAWQVRPRKGEPLCLMISSSALPRWCRLAV